MVDMKHLTNLAKKALASPTFLNMIELLKKEIVESEEPFIWRVLSERLIGAAFPEGILSAWVFVLKPDTCSPSHQHPNSIQCSTIIEGGGKIRIADDEEEIRVFDPRRIEKTWYVIPRNVPHSVVTRHYSNVVLSFHTSSAKKLEEVETFSGRSQFYRRHSLTFSMTTSGLRRESQAMFAGGKCVYGMHNNLSLLDVGMM